MAGMTVKDMRACKGKRQLTFIRIDSAEDAVAAEAAGIDSIGTAYGAETRGFPAHAPNTHFRFGLKYGRHATSADAMREAFQAMADGAGSIYCPMSIAAVADMAREGIPVIGHVGLVPSWRTWTGGFRAVGKTAAEALRLFDQVRAYEDAGALGIEVEVVPHRIAAEISRRTSLLTVSVGAGAGCDIQYLFARDILGDNAGHVPRHAKVYRDFRAERRRLEAERVAAFGEYRADVESGRFPEAGNLVDLPDAEYERFLEGLETRS